MIVGLGWIDPADPTDWAVARGLSEALRGLGLDTIVFGPKKNKKDPTTEKINGIRIHRCRNGKEVFRLASLAGIERWHLHVFGRDPAVFLDAIRGDGRPLVSTFHLILPDYLPHAGGKKRLGEIIRRSSAVTAVSGHSARQLRALFPGRPLRPRVIHNGSLSAAPSGPGLRRKRPYALCVARLAPYKGVDVLVMALALTARKLRDLTVVVCGEDKTRGGLARFAERLGLRGRIRFTGSLPPGRVAALLRDCRFFVLPSRRENFPLALLEAMRAGKACLATRVGGIPEMIKEGRDGLLAAPGDAEDLARGLVRLAGDPPLRRRLGAAARRRVAPWTWRQAAVEYRSLYSKVR